MKKTLKELAPGESGVVTGINATGAIKRRLFDMGVTPGVCITMRKHAPLGDPIEVRLRGYELSLRKAEANEIILDVEKIS